MPNSCGPNTPFTARSNHFDSHSARPHNDRTDQCRRIRNAGGYPGYGRHFDWPGASHPADHAVRTAGAAAEIHTRGYATGRKQYNGPFDQHNAGTPLQGKESRMQFATWNLNSLNVRLDHVLAWLEKIPVDVLALQETKLTDDRFPVEALAEAGYSSVFCGQKTYNGVAL